MTWFFIGKALWGLFEINGLLFMVLEIIKLLQSQMAEHQICFKIFLFCTLLPLFPVNYVLTHIVPKFTNYKFLYMVLYMPQRKINLMSLF